MFFNFRLIFKYLILIYFPFQILIRSSHEFHPIRSPVHGIFASCDSIRDGKIQPKHNHGERTSRRRPFRRGRRCTLFTTGRRQRFPRPGSTQRATDANRHHTTDNDARRETGRPPTNSSNPSRSCTTRYPKQHSSNAQIPYIANTNTDVSARHDRPDGRVQPAGAGRERRTITGRRSTGYPGSDDGSRRDPTARFAAHPSGAATR